MEGGAGGDEGGVGGGEVALGGEGLEGGAGAEGLFLAGDVEGFGGEVAGLLGGDDAGLRLVKGVLGVADFDADLFAELFGAELGLAGFDFGAVLVGLGDAVAQGEVEGEANVVVGGGVVEGVRDGAAVVSGGGGGDGGGGIAGAAEAGAGVIAGEGEGGQEGVAGGRVRDGAGAEVDLGDGQLGPAAEGFGDDVFAGCDGGQRCAGGDGGQVGGADGDGFEGGVVEIFGEGVFDEELLELELGAGDGEVLLAVGDFGFVLGDVEGGDGLEGEFFPGGVEGLVSEVDGAGFDLLVLVGADEGPSTCWRSG